MSRYKPRTSGDPSLWKFAFYLAALMAFGYLVGLTIAHWPAVAHWIWRGSPWWFLPLCGFVGMALVLLAAAWHDLFPGRDR